MLASIPHYAQARFLEDAPTPEESAPSRDDSPSDPPTSTLARPESVPAFVVAWEWRA